MNFWDATGTSNSDPAETWRYASDAVLEERVYYLHDWHQDLVQLIGDDGAAVERVHYPAYGVPFGLHPADLDHDGDVDGSDFSKFSTLYSNGTYDVLADFDHDGDEDATDYVAFAGLYSAGETLGRGNLTRSTTDNRVGYAGYQWDRFVSKYHVRNRVYEPTTARWLNRDPIEYDAGTMNLYGYVDNVPLSYRDPLGLGPIPDGPNDFDYVPPSPPPVPPLRLKPNPSIGFYNPNVRSLYGFGPNHSRWAATRQCDIAIPATSVEEATKKLEAFLNAHPGNPPSRITIWDHAEEGVQYLGDHPINPGKWNL